VGWKGKKKKGELKKRRLREDFVLKQTTEKDLLYNHTFQNSEKLVDSTGATKPQTKKKISKKSAQGRRRGD